MESCQWLLQDRSQKHIREQEKIISDIKDLQKIIEDLQWALTMITNVYTYFIVILMNQPE